MLPADFHIHTCRDHGKGTPADFASQAARSGITLLGLVGHAQMEFPCSYAMTPAAESTFLAEMTALKSQFPGQLFRGIELDYYSLPVTLPYDYRIGSVHYVRAEGRVISVDSDPDELASDVQSCFGGDFRRFYQLYYETVADIMTKTGADIVGHFDLVTKFNEDDCLFSTADPAYRRAALEAVDALLEKDPLFEINTRDKTWFAYSEAEKAEILSKLAGQKVTVARSKGLGENDPEMMALTTMNPATRRMIKVMPEDAEKTALYFDLLLGDNLQGRKDYIAENGSQYLDVADIS